MRAIAPSLLLVISACGGPDLPAGWEDAVPLTLLEQSECSGDPYGSQRDRLELSARVGVVVVGVREAHFRCEQPVEGFRLDLFGGFDVLVQPQDMDPSSVAACDCLYDLRFETAVESAGLYRVAGWRRWDNMNTDNPLVSIGTSTVTVPKDG